MSVSITQQPPLLSPAYNDIVVVASSTHIIDKFKTKYVSDIFSTPLNATGSIYLGRIRTTPNPSGVGMLDISRYLQLQNSQDLVNGSMYNIPTASKLISGTTTLNAYNVIVGEEYAESISGSVVLYNGNGTASTGETLTSTTTITGYSFNGVKQFSDGPVWNQAPYVTPSGRELLTNSPRTLYKETDEYITTACFYGTYSGTSFGITGGTYARVYDNQNNLIKTYNPSSGFTATSSQIVPIFCGVNIADVVSGFSNTWYKILLQIGTGNQTEILTIINKGCPWLKYNPMDIIFLNRLGAWDTFRFYGSKQEGIKVERETYERLPGTWSSTLYTYNTYERGTSNIRADVEVSGEVMSDYLDRDTVNWLEELITSPQIFKIEDNTLTPINITDSNFNRQVKGNVKLRQVSFKYIYSNQIRTQQQ